MIWILIALIVVTAAAPVMLLFTAKFVRPRSTNLELHKFYKNKYPASELEKQRYEYISDYFMEKEVNKKVSEI